jgi:hypothetical protein
VSRTLLAVALLLLVAPALAHADASNPTTQEVLDLAGPQTCAYGGFTDIMPRQVDIPIIDLDPGILEEYCFHLPRLRKRQLGVKTNGFVQFQTANLGNSSCGTASLYVIRPDRKSIFGLSYPAPRTAANVNQVQPAAILPYTAGTWRVLIEYASGDCRKYSLTATW